MPSTRVEYPQQIDALTSLRFIAASWVVVFHLKEFTRSEILQSSGLTNYGYLGVDFFFVLSGFVLTHVYKRSVDENRFDYWGFISKRLGRIYPMHLVTLVVSLLMGLAAMALHLEFEIWDPAAPFTQLDRGQLFRALLAHLTLIHAWGATDGLLFNLPSWSISAEWFAYLLFPVYMLLFKTSRLGPRALVALSVALFLAMAAGCVVAMNLELTKMSWNIGLLRIVPEFLLGTALYVLGQRWSAGVAVARAGLASSVLLALGGIALGTYLPSLHAAGAAVTVLGLAGVVFFAADGDRYAALPWLSNPFFVLLGEISYSVYMLHLLVAICVFQIMLPAYRPEGLVESLAAIGGVLTLVTLLSWATYKLIEVPGRNAIVGFARKLNRLPVPPASGASAEAPRT